jgi:DNA-binding MarR family transcriptional regulator
VKRAAGAGLPAQTPPAGAPAPLGGGRAGALSALIDEATALFHRLKVAAEQVHQQGSVSAGRRGLLRSLASGGPQSVPQLARARPVSRQLVQTLVNGLLADGYVEYAENPAHRRSHLVRLTRAGRALVAQMDRRERGILNGLDLGISRSELVSAASTLRRLRSALESAAWRESLRSERAPRGGDT